MMRALPRPKRREPTIALINVVFLMLVFFMVAGSLTQTDTGAVSLVRVADLDPSQAGDALVIHADGRLQHNGQSLAAPADFVAGRPPEALATLRILPDRDLPAAQLLRIAAALRAAGAERVIVVTERGVP